MTKQYWHFFIGLISHFHVVGGKLIFAFLAPNNRVKNINWSWIPQGWHIFIISPYFPPSDLCNAGWLFEYLNLLRCNFMDISIYAWLQSSLLIHELKCNVFMSGIRLTRGEINRYFTFAMSHIRCCCFLFSKHEYFLLFNQWIRKLTSAWLMRPAQGWIYH